MTVIGVMSQPLRASYAKAYLGRCPPENRRVLVTAVAGSVDTTGSSDGIELLAQHDQPRVLPSRRLMARIRGRAARWARTSHLGVRIVRFARQAEWRHLDRVAVLLDDRRNSQPVQNGDALVALLESVWSTDAVDEIVVFDLFDLPAVLRFAEDKAVTVRVR